MKELIIIGGGPAAMTAAIYANRKQIDEIMITPEIGGQAIWARNIENYLGFQLIDGYDLITRFEDHIKKFNVPVINETVAALSKSDDIFTVKLANNEEHQAHAVIVASGRSARKLGVPGEQEYTGRGVAYCATCDAPLFADLDVAVAGGGNAGLDAALQLSGIARRVYLVEEMDSLVGDPHIRDLVLAEDNTTIMLKSRITRINGDTFVKSMSVEDLSTGIEQEIPVGGIFVEIGSKPNTDFLPSDVGVNDKGEITIDCMNHTNIPGLFAAGDVTSIPGKQIIIAAGEGSKAALSAYSYLVRHFPKNA
jgi:alkyl hydroperoxide reductase subunit F